MPRRNTTGSSTSASVVVWAPKPVASASSASAMIEADSTVRKTVARLCASFQISDRAASRLQCSVARIGRRAARAGGRPPAGREGRRTVSGVRRPGRGSGPSGVVVGGLHRGPPPGGSWRLSPCGLCPGGCQKVGGGAELEGRHRSAVCRGDSNIPRASAYGPAVTLPDSRRSEPEPTCCPARARTWQAGAGSRRRPAGGGRGRHAPGAHSPKPGAAGTDKHGYGCSPLVAFLDHGDGTGETVSGILRPGNAGSDTAATTSRWSTCAGRAAPRGPPPADPGPGRPRRLPPTRWLTTYASAGTILDQPARRRTRPPRRPGGAVASAGSASSTWADCRHENPSPAPGYRPALRLRRLRLPIRRVSANYSVHLMRPAHTHGSAHRVDLVVGSSESSGRQVVRRARAVVPAPRRGAGGGRCSGQRTRPAPTAAAGIPRSASGPAAPAEPCRPTARRRHSPAAPAPA